jgi:methylated-DNA-[protein]-cysteine S-methyltransferase
MSDFNQKVWQALKLIPRGKVTTYKSIAQFMGQPKAARAVGNACNKNPDAPIVPCHRVVKSDGRIGGYAGGAKKKIQLLKKEGVSVEKGVVKEFKEKIFKFK